MNCETIGAQCDTPRHAINGDREQQRVKDGLIRRATRRKQQYQLFTSGILNELNLLREC